MRVLLVVAVASSLAVAGPPKPKTVSSPNGETSVMESPLVCPSKVVKAQQLYNSGLDAEEAGDLERARDLFQQALKADPKYCDAMDNLGLMYRRAGLLDEAIGWYRKSLTLQSKNGTARMNLAAALRMKKDLPAAATEYSALIKVLPEDPEGHFGLGAVLLDQGKPADAVKPLLEAERLYVAEGSAYVPDAQVLLVRAYTKLERWADAAKVLEALRAAAPGDAQLTLQLGTALVRSGKVAEGKRLLLQARAAGLNLEPDVAAKAGL